MSDVAAASVSESHDPATLERIAQTLSASVLFEPVKFDQLTKAIADAMR